MKIQKMQAEKLLRLWEIFKIFFKISTVSLGGGLIMLPMMQREFVTRRHWLTENDMVDTVAIMQSMPGIIASNMGVLLGYRIAGIPGALSAVAGSTIPPFTAIILLAAVMQQLQEYAMVQQIFSGVRACVAAMILLSVFSLGKKIIRGRLPAAIFLLSFIALIFFNADAICIIIVAALAGIIPVFFNFLRQTFDQKKGGQAR